MEEELEELVEAEAAGLLSEEEEEEPLEGESDFPLDFEPLPPLDLA